MAPGTAEAIKQIDEVLERYTQLEANFRVTGQDDMASWDYLGPPAVLAAEVIWLLRAALERLSPDGDRAAERALTLTRDECYPESASIRNLAGALRALKADYEAGR